MRVRDKCFIDWSTKEEWLVKGRYLGAERRGVRLRPLSCGLGKSNLYGGYDLTGVKVAVIYSRPESLMNSEYSEADAEMSRVASWVVEALSLRGLVARSIELYKENLAELDQVGKDEVVFNLCEWTGKDLELEEEVFARINKRGLIYTGSDWPTYQLNCDKTRVNKKLIEAGVKMPRGQGFESGDERLDSSLKFPLIVKPAWEHCSIGIENDSVVKDEGELRKVLRNRIGRFGQPMLVEEFIAGREFQVTVLEDGGKSWALPPAEITFKKDAKSWPIMSFGVKWDPNIREEDDPSEDVYVPELDELLDRKIRMEAVRAFEAIGVRGYGRADIREQDGQVYVLEMNCNPGLDEHFSYGMTLSAWAVGLTFSDLCLKIVGAALERARNQRVS